MEKIVHKKYKGFARIIRAFTHSMNGFKSCFKTEEAFRQEIILIIFLLPLGLWLGETASEKALLVGSLFIVLIVEILNTAIERTIDRISLDHHPLSGEAKDMGSSAVLLALMLTIVTWGLVLLT